MNVENTYENMFSDNAALANGADMRIMSFNILCEIWNDKPTISGRDEKAVAILMNYAPDVVGLQEISPNWHSALEPLLDSSPYKMIGKHNTVMHSKYGNINFSPIIYNSDTVKPIDSGVRAYSVAAKIYAYVMTWGHFKHISSGKDFAVINTHFDLRREGEHNNNRTQQAKEIAAFINELKGRYGCPVIITGDYNTMESEDRFKIIINDAQMHEAKYSAHIIKRACATYHTLGSSISTANANSHDHILGSNGIKFLYYNVLVDKIVIETSDHCPIYADVMMN